MGKLILIEGTDCSGKETQSKLLKEKIEKVASFKDIFIVDTAGVSSMYANDGGIIMVV